MKIGDILIQMEYSLREHGVTPKGFVLCELTKQILIRENRELLNEIKVTTIQPSVSQDYYHGLPIRIDPTIMIGIE